MGRRGFAARIDRLNRRHAAADLNAGRHETPISPARGGVLSRSDRLAKALHLLRQNGIGGGFAYPPPFRALAAVGLGPRPLYYWSVPALFVFNFFLFAALGSGLMWLSGMLDRPPRSLRRLAEAPTEVNLVICTVLAALGTFQHKRIARRAGLLKWKDL